MISGASTKTDIAIVGGGPVGALFFAHLAKRGLDVHLFEKRPDARTASAQQHRSINLAVSPRSYHALNRVGLRREVLQDGSLMRGSFLHFPRWNPTLPYGYRAFDVAEQNLTTSVSRLGFGRNLLTAAERLLGGRFHFEHELNGIDWESNTLRFYDAKAGETRTVQAQMIFGTDGARSFLRQEMIRRHPSRYRFENLDSNLAYKELHIPARDGAWPLQGEAIHIWPRGPITLLATPNANRSYSAAALIPATGADSFETLQTGPDVRRFFRRYFSDSIPVIEDLEAAFLSHPLGHLGTMKCYPWISPEARVALLGDSAHAMLHLYAQGMNCGFEDVTTLMDLIAKHEGQGCIPWREVLERFQVARKPESDAIADLSVANYHESTNPKDRKRMILLKLLDAHLAKCFPGLYVPRATLILFSRTPYTVALEVSRIQDGILSSLVGRVGSLWKYFLSKHQVAGWAEPLVRERLAPWQSRYLFD